MSDESAVLGEPAVVVLGVRSEDAVDHHRKDRHLGRAHRIGERDVDGCVLQWGEAAVEDGLGECSDQVTSSGGDLALPLGIAEARGSMPLVERVQSRGHPVPEHDRPPAHRFGDRRVLALRIAGDVHPATERDGSRVEALGERGLAGADDPREHDVRRGDDALRVEHPGVVDERSPAVEILADEHASRAEPALGEERICPCQRRACVLVARKPETARRAECCGPRLAGRWQVGRRPTCLAFRLPCRPRPLLLGLAVGGLDLARRSPSRLPRGAALARRVEQDRGVQELAVAGAHSDSPRRELTGGASNGSRENGSNSGRLATGAGCHAM